MNFVSTRNKSVQKTAAEAIKQGISAEGGLFWPESIPAVTMQEICDLAQCDYKVKAEFVLGKFLTDFTAEEIKKCVENAYTTDKFDTSEIAPLHKLNDDAYTLELWHGPTCAFKDMALQILPHLMTTSIRKTGEDKKVVILAATSGDTGKAALEGFCNVENTRVIVFYPNDGVSNIQKKQMISQEGDNTYVTAVVGNFDDCQTNVKKIFANDSLRAKLAKNDFVFSSANSINWGRLVPQVVYYFSAYCDLIKNKAITPGEAVDFVVPTGNFGDILAGFIAKKMGIPVHKLVCASNRNNILTDFIKTGVYDTNRPFYTTMSPSMDILVSSNLERLLFALSEDDQLVSSYMKQLASDKKYTADDELMNKLRDGFEAGYTDEAQTTETIRKYFEEYNYLVDPHTAVALNVYEQNKSEYKAVILSTASPYKFPESVAGGISVKSSTANEWELLDLISEKSKVAVPAPLSGLKNKEDRFTGVCTADEMANDILKFLMIQE